MSEIIKEFYEVETINHSSDYIGFTFNNTHSSSLGILRTSDGSRFNENLLPTIQDKTIQVPGGDGTYYFGSFYTQKQFNIPFAFDSLTEEQFSALKRWLGDKQIHELIFDELPYKAYQAKITGSATIKHIPFDEDGKRIYKGEGSVQFTAYYPYAKSTFKFLNDDKAINLNNINEWQAASKLRTNPYIVEDESTTYDELSANSINLYNAGDIETHFQFKIKFVDDKIPASKIYIDGDTSRQLLWNEIKVKGADTYIKINTKLNIIEGYNAEDKKTGNVYNQYIEAGSFFKIPLGESKMLLDDANGIASNLELNPIEYDYYYF